MPRTPSTADRKDINFTVKLAPSQVQFLASLRPALRAQSEQGVLRELLEQFESWFRLPPYQSERLEQDKASRQVNLLRELLMRRTPIALKGRQQSQIKGIERNHAHLLR